MKDLRLSDLVLAPAAALYGLAVSTRLALYHAGILKQRRLRGGVVSVGNLTVGGTGKTAAIMALARWLEAPGRRLGVLTRGYGRRAREIVVLQGTQIAEDEFGNLVEQAGDEPVLLAQHLREIPIGVAADRFAAGRRLEEKHGVNLFLLDDGFQHLRLHRDVDIVLLDATAAPAAVGRRDALLPCGRLREPWSALRRAHIVIITRTEQAEPEQWIQRARAANPGLAIFCARTALECVREAASPPRRAELPPQERSAKRWLAFCGLGNNRAFLTNLKQWGFEIGGLERFPDHHRYARRDLDRLLRVAAQNRCEALLTTEKDIVNWHLPGPTPLPIYYCRIAFAMDEPERVVAEIERRLRAAS